MNFSACRPPPENMESPKRLATTLHSAKLLPIVPFNRIFSIFYLLAIIALFYHHAKTLYCSTTTPLSFFITLILISSDLVFAFMWSTAQASRIKSIKREEYPENVDKVIKRSEYPGLDVFICTADPTKEPPVSVVNTALSVLAYDYPAEKLSVYISDDGGSVFTLFAFMEAAKFASHWLPFCRENNVMERSPDAFFESNYFLSLSSTPEIDNIKMMYEDMKMRIEHVMDRGKIDDDCITSENQRKALNQWTNNFTCQDHPTIIQILLESNKNKDMDGHFMPNLIYVSREKNKSSRHNFKAGALNTLVRVSAVMTNAPIILTIDCDVRSNDPQTPLRVLCYFLDPKTRNKFAYVQFPQQFKKTDKNDIYASQFKRLFFIQSMGFDGIQGPNYVGTGCFFSRKALFGSPSNPVLPEIPELRPDRVVDQHLRPPEVLTLAYRLADCNYENHTTWGSKMGFRYGSLVEDLYTGYRLHCEGWRSIFCNPKRAAFLGDSPFTLLDFITQQKRWSVGVLQMGFSKYSPIVYGIKHLPPLMTLIYSQYSFWSIWFFPLTIYSFLPALALLNNVPIFPKVSEAWFFLYIFLFLGAYGQDLLDFILIGEGTFKMWWNDQRVSTLRGVTCFLFGFLEFFLNSLGISLAQSFDVTTKVVDDESSKRYYQGIFEFGVSSPMFVTLSMAALINLVSFLWGLVQVVQGSNYDGLVLQMLLAGYGVAISWPIYEAMVFRKDKGKMPTKTSFTSLLFTCLLYLVSSVIFN